MCWLQWRRREIKEGCELFWAMELIGTFPRLTFVGDPVQSLRENNKQRA
jgi:hypothetical protein